MIRTAVVTALAVALGAAPVQCSREPDPTNRREDTAGDALWDLAQEFRAKGNEASAKETLRFLVERYPSNRHVPAARAELETPGSTAAP